MYNVLTAYERNARKPLWPLDLGEFFPCDEFTEFRLESAWVAKVRGGEGYRWYECLCRQANRNLKPALYALRYGAAFPTYGGSNR